MYVPTEKSAEFVDSFEFRVEDIENFEVSNKINITEDENEYSFSTLSRDNRETFWDEVLDSTAVEVSSNVHTLGYNFPLDVTSFIGVAGLYIAAFSLIVGIFIHFNETVPFVIGMTCFGFSFLGTAIKDAKKRAPTEYKNQTAYETKLRKLNKNALFAASLVTFLIYVNAFDSETVVEEVGEPIVSDQVPPVVDSSIKDVTPQVSEEVESSVSQRDLAIQADTDLMILLTRSDELMDAMRQGLVVLANGQCTTLELYQMTAQILTQQEEIYKLLALYKSEASISNYKNAGMIYVKNLKEVAEALMEYLDSPTVSTEAKYLELADLRTTYAFNVTSKRMTFLADHGFSDDEILMIIG